MKVIGGESKIKNALPTLLTDNSMGLSQNETKTNLVICLGAPRSGLNLIAKCLGILGFFNAEQEDVMAGPTLIHGLLCQDLGISTLEAGNLPVGWQSTSAAKRARQRIRKLLTKHVEANVPWVLVDPFLARSFPLWQDVITKMNLHPRFVHLVRHPWEVARSLAVEKNLDLSKAHLVWLSHVRDVMCALEKLDSIMLTFDQLLVDPINSIHTLLAGCRSSFKKQSSLLFTHYSLILDYVHLDQKHFHAGKAPKVEMIKFTPFSRIYDHLRTLQCEPFYTCATDSKNDSRCKPENTLTDVGHELELTWDLFEFLLEEYGCYARKEKEKQTFLRDVDSGGLYATIFLPRTKAPAHAHKMPILERQWQQILIQIPQSVFFTEHALTMVPLNTNGLVSISAISLVDRSTGEELWSAKTIQDFEQVRIIGTAFRLFDNNNLVLLITGNQPKIILPPIRMAEDLAITLILWIKASKDQSAINKHLNFQNRVYNYLSRRFKDNDMVCCDSESYNGKNLFSPEINHHFFQSVVQKLLNEKEEHNFESLYEISRAIQRITGEMEPFKIVMSNFKTDEKRFYLVHIADDHIPKEILKSGTFYEREYLEILGAFHRPGEIVVDVGANIGNHTLYFAKIIEADVIAFEPEPHNALILAVNIELNKALKKVRLFKHALGNKSGFIKLQMAVKKNFGSFSFAIQSQSTKNEVANSLPVDVQIKTLDQSLKDMKLSSFLSILKIDVEGMEYEVLKGAQESIKRSLPVIGVECFHKSDFESIENMLSKYNYFPFMAINWTPTFIFLSQDNPFHIKCLSGYLRKKSLECARKKKCFIE